ncbi:hypothetical protein Dimus_036185 [Dionaea muscipula]
MVIVTLGEMEMGGQVNTGVSLQEEREDELGELAGGSTVVEEVTPATMMVILIDVSLSFLEMVITLSALASGGQVDHA